MGTKRWAVAAAVLVIGGSVGIGGAGRAATGCPWGEYGHDPDLTFETSPGCSTITTHNVATLIPKWFFHAKDSVTASPAVVGDTVYVGDWSGAFYALNAANGKVRWSFQITLTDQIAFGRIVSSAVVANFPDAHTGHPRQVVVFGGGSSLWALDASTGKLLAQQDLDPRTPALRAKEATDPPTVEVESSPVVASVKVNGHPQQVIYSGMDVHNGKNVGPAGVVAMTLSDSRAGHWSFTPIWKRDAERSLTYRGPGLLTANSGTGWGCGDVWSSPAVDAAAGVVVFGTGNCDNVTQARAAGFTYSETMNAVSAATGAPLWRFQPAALQPNVIAQNASAYDDDDFGASPNIFRLRSGEMVAGEGEKSSVYWLRDLRTGKPVWGTQSGTPGNLEKNFAVGGFIGSTAVQTDAGGAGVRVIGGTAIGFPKTLSDIPGVLQQVHAFDAVTGKVAWTFSLGGPTYAATSVTNGIAFVPDTVPSDLVALDAASGLPLWAFPVIGPSSSTAVVSGSSVYLGTGTSETDLEYKAIGLTLQKGFTDLIGESPLALLGGVQAFRLAGG